MNKIAFKIHLIVFISPIYIPIFILFMDFKKKKKIYSSQINNVIKPNNK